VWREKLIWNESVNRSRHLHWFLQGTFPLPCLAFRDFWRKSSLFAGKPIKSVCLCFCIQGATLCPSSLILLLQSQYTVWPQGNKVSKPETLLSLSLILTRFLSLSPHPHPRPLLTPISMMNNGGAELAISGTSKLAIFCVYVFIYKKCRGSVRPKFLKLESVYDFLLLWNDLSISALPIPSPRYVGGIWLKYWILLPLNPTLKSDSKVSRKAGNLWGWGLLADLTLFRRATLTVGKSET
jgi:hypothetical protein